MGSCMSCVSAESQRSSLKSSISSPICGTARESDCSDRVGTNALPREPLISAVFKRTVFLEDIAYEYEASLCAPSVVPSWTFRVSVEQLTKFYLETFALFCDASLIPVIPDPFEKIVSAHVFTQLLNPILQACGSLCAQSSTSIRESTANLLQIPSDVRWLLEYDAESFTHNKTNINNNFRFNALVDAHCEKYKYLCHHSTVHYSQHEAPTACDSLWLRSLQCKVDFMVTITSNHALFVTISDATLNTANALKDSCECDDLLAWTIADYVPKYLPLTTHEDVRVVYSFDPLTDVETFADANGVCMEELLLFCHSIRSTHDSMLPMAYAVSDSDEEEAEYIVSMSDVDDDKYMALFGASEPEHSRSPHCFNG